MYVRKANSQAVDTRKVKQTATGKQRLRQFFSLTALSLFSGCGGDSLGLERAGITVTHFVETDKDAIDSHQANFPHSQLLDDSTFEQLRGRIDVVFGGKWQLFHHFVRAVAAIRPKYLIGEDAKGIITDPILAQMITEFNAIGYETTALLVDVQEFGVPQNQERVILVGTKIEDKNHHQVIEQIKAIQSVQPDPVSQFLRQTLEGAIDITTHQIIQDIKVFHKVDDSIQVCGTPPSMLKKCFQGTSNPGFSYEKRQKPIFSCVVNIEGVINTNRISRLFVPVENATQKFLRPFTVDELQQIQGFPCDFMVKGSKSSQIRQISNAVAPAVVEALVRALIA